MPPPSLGTSLVRNFKCSQCEYSTTTDHELFIHKMGHNTSGRYQCDLCNYSDPTVLGIIKHRKDHSAKPPAQKPRKYKKRLDVLMETEVKVAEQNPVLQPDTKQVDGRAKELKQKDAAIETFVPKSSVDTTTNSSEMGPDVGDLVHSQLSNSVGNKSLNMYSGSEYTVTAGLQEIDVFAGNSGCNGLFLIKNDLPITCKDNKKELKSILKATKSKSNGAQEVVANFSGISEKLSDSGQDIRWTENVSTSEEKLLFTMTNNLIKDKIVLGDPVICVDTQTGLIFQQQPLFAENDTLLPCLEVGNFVPSGLILLTGNSKLFGALCDEDACELECESFKGGVLEKGEDDEIKLDLKTTENRLGKTGEFLISENMIKEELDLTDETSNMVEDALVCIETPLAGLQIPGVLPGIRHLVKEEQPDKDASIRTPGKFEKTTMDTKVNSLFEADDSSNSLNCVMENDLNLCTDKICSSIPAMDSETYMGEAGPDDKNTASSGAFPGFQIYSDQFLNACGYGSGFMNAPLKSNCASDFMARDTMNNREHYLTTASTNLLEGADKGSHFAIDNQIGPEVVTGRDVAESTKSDGIDDKNSPPTRRVYECPTCRAQFPSQKCCDAHYKSRCRHRFQPTAETPPGYDLEIETPRTMRFDLADFTPRLKPEFAARFSNGFRSSSSVDVVREEDLACSKCDFVAKDKLLLYIHEMTHNTSGVYFCDMCTKQTHSVMAALVHRKRHYQMESPESKKRKRLKQVKKQLSLMLNDKLLNPEM